MDSRTPKTIFSGSVILCFLFLLCLLAPQNASCAEAVNVKEGLLSVNFKDTSLLDVARDIEKQSGIRFRGDETLFHEKISVTFNDLPVEEGLKRILANLNYSLMLDAKNRVAGVMVMGEGKPAGTQPGRPGLQPPRVATPPGTTPRPSPAVRSRSTTPTTAPATVRRPPRTVPHPGGAASQPPGSGATQSPLPDAFKVQEAAPTPGGPAVSDGPLPPAFRVIENPPPPAGTPQGTATGPRGSTPAPNAPSPGDSAKKDSTP